MVGNCVFGAPVVIGSRNILLVLATCALSGGVVRQLRTR